MLGQVRRSELKRLKVLVVDDEEELVTALVERLDIRGFDSEGVTSGKKALERVAKDSFDVVLLDVKMPGIGGLKVIEQINEKHPDLAVILLTGHGSAVDRFIGTQMGCFEYLMKPVKIDELVETIKRAAGCEEHSSEGGDQ